MENFVNFCSNVLDSVMDSAYQLYPSYLGQDSCFTESDDIPRDSTQPVWILGKRYNGYREIELIRRDVNSRLWCTYRRGFPPLGDNCLTSDRGWGCMLRCGQMVMAQAIIDLHLGREWFWTTECRDPTYLKIVNRFEDSKEASFSIHQIALMGSSEDKKVGEWFGPNTVAQVLKKLTQFDDWCAITIHVAMDNCVVIEDIENLCASDGDSWKPLLLIVPLRLGITEINSVYFDALKICFEIQGCVGMIGGRPNQALYFIGYTADEALYLDPHRTQKSGSVGDKTEDSGKELDDTYHRQYASRLPFNQLDTSMAVCFLAKTREEFDTMCTTLRSRITNLDASSYPLFEISEKKLMPWLEEESPQETTQRKKSEDFVEINSNDENSEEEFELI